MQYEEYVGKNVIYVSESGREYFAAITSIPDRPQHAGTSLPTVSLEFRDDRRKLVRKQRVLPEGVANCRRQVYRLEAEYQLEKQGD